mmetsp:Transcript_53129/g.129780  ORF Transcript_53129/g.129780 Transcript_53129/m.129780 type:complete len:223 (-) Transcript_53129:124-792(-)
MQARGHAAPKFERKGGMTLAAALMAGQAAKEGQRARGVKRQSDEMSEIACFPVLAPPGHPPAIDSFPDRRTYDMFLELQGQMFSAVQEARERREAERVKSRRVAERFPIRFEDPPAGEASPRAAEDEGRPSADVRGRSMDGASGACTPEHIAQDLQGPGDTGHALAQGIAKCGLTPCLQPVPVTGCHHGSGCRGVCTCGKKLAFDEDGIPLLKLSGMECKLA